MSLRYPADRPSGAVDVVTFTHEKYSGGGGGGGGGPIVLYHPESTPAISNSNDWVGSGTKFSGPRGAFNKKLAGAIADASQDGNLNDISGTVANAIERFKGTDAGPIGRQFLLESLAPMAGLTANQALSVSRGEIYNPNVELFYNGPQLRKFTFQFNFWPKSSADGQAAMNIIREFKKWSAPQEKGAKYEIPHVWRINYSNKNYNKFKRAACIDVNVDYNSGLEGHMTFIDGMPLITGMTLTFLEAELVTRKDHTSGSGF